MPARGAIYIQVDDVDLRKAFDSVVTDKGLFRPASYFDVDLGGEVVRFNVMPSADVGRHLEGFLGYISSLDQDEKRKQDAISALSRTKVVLGLVTNKEFEENHAIWQCLFEIADKYDGLVFVYDSVLLPNGAVLVGPLLETTGA